MNINMNSLKTVTKGRSASMINEKNVPDDIKAIENQIETLKSNLQRNIWLLGQRLHKIRDNRLFEDNFKTFEDYCESKLNISSDTANKFIRIYNTFDFTATLRYDYTKLDEVAKIQDEQKRTELLKRIADENLSTKIVRSLVKEIRRVPVKAHTRTTGINFDKLLNSIKKMDQKNITTKEKDVIRDLIQYLENLL